MILPCFEPMDERIVGTFVYSMACCGAANVTYNDFGMLYTEISTFSFALREMVLTMSCQVHQQSPYYKGFHPSPKPIIPQKENVSKGNFTGGDVTFSFCRKGDIITLH